MKNDKTSLIRSKSLTIGLSNLDNRVPITNQQDIEASMMFQLDDEIYSMDKDKPTLKNNVKIIRSFNTESLFEENFYKHYLRSTNKYATPPIPIPESNKKYSK